MIALNTKKVDIANIGLILISLLIAIKLPFRLFLFSYAILGPLHYLTEINWLRDKNYFVKAKANWVWLFAILALLMSIAPLLDFFNLGSYGFIEVIKSRLRDNSTLFILISFAFSIGLVFYFKWQHLMLNFAIAVVISVFCIAFIPLPALLVGVFLPTLLHVYVFTFLFILYGAIKAKSPYGFYLGIALLCVPVLIGYLPYKFFNNNPSEMVLQVFASSEMDFVSTLVAVLFNGLDDGKFVQLSEIGIRIQAFIAFAYTYHYLNWFSKTSVIGWKKALTKKNSILILFIWILAVAIYIYDFKTGFIALFFLSFLHVLLEFPLNIITIKELLSYMRLRLIRK